MGETGYLISEAAKQSGVESHVLRYWEEELKLPIARNEMGHRYYTKQDIQIFLTIKELKKRGFQLKMIRELVPRIEDVQMEQAKAESDKKVEAKEVIAHDKASGNEVRETVVNDKFSENEVKDVAVKSVAAESETVKGETVKSKAVEGRAVEGRAVEGEAGKGRTAKGEAGKSGTLKGEAAKNDGVKNVTTGKETAKGFQKSENKKAEEKVKNQASQEAAKKMGKLKLKQVKSVPVRDIKKEQEEKIRKVNQQEAFYQIMERLFVQLTGEKRSEDRYKRLDAAIRKHQYSRRMVAATEEQGKKRKKK